MKKFLKIFAAFLAVVILALLAIPMFVSSDMLKTRVTAELSKATGRTITIEGNASLKLFPDIAVSLENVTLGNPAGDFASERMFFAKKLETGVRLMPLLNKEIIITGVTLDGAEIHLEETKSGAKNWEFASKASSDTKQEKTKEEGAAQKFAIGDIAVKDSSVSYSPANGKAIALSSIDIALSGADGNEPLVLDGSAEYKGKQVSLSLDVKDSRGFLAGTASPVVAEIALPGGKITFNGTAEKKTDIAAKGDLDVDVSALPALMEWATGKPAAASTPKKVALKGPISLTGKRLAFSNLKAQIDDLSTSGKLTVDMNGSVPSIVGALKFGVIDTAQFTGKPGASSASSNAPAAGGEGWSSKPIDLSGLKAANAKLALTVDGIKSGKLDIGASAFDVNLQGGLLKLAIESLSLYGGNAKGVINASSGGIGAALDVTGVKIEPLMVALTGKSKLSGTAAMDLNLKGQGTSQKAIVNSLGGNAKFTFRDGAIKGINLGQFLRNAKQGNFTADDSQSTDFAELGGSWVFANGIGTNNDLSMKAPILRMTGSGTINLPNRSLNYKLMPSLVASAKGQDGKDKSGLTIPLLVTGPWSKPSITPDLAGMLQEGLRDPEALKENLKNLQGGLKNFNSPSDIGKALLGGGTETAPAAATTTTTEPAAAPAAAPAPVDPKKQALENLLKGFGN